MLLESLNILDNIYFFIFSYSVLGAGLKYIDDAFDERPFSKINGLILSPFLGVLWALTMIVNPFSTTILLAIILGVLFKGKIDNLAHLIGLISIVSIIIIAKVELLFLPLVFLTAAGVIDEIGNDIASYNKDLPKNKFRYNFIKYFFGRRYFLKVALLYLVLIGVFPLHFLLALIFFDEAYIIVEMYSGSIITSKQL